MKLQLGAQRIPKDYSLTQSPDELFLILLVSPLVPTIWSELGKLWLGSFSALRGTILWLVILATPSLAATRLRMLQAIIRLSTNMGVYLAAHK